MDKRNKLYKAVMTNGYAEACERQSGEQLMNWALRYLGKEGYRISRSGIEQLLSNAGDDMENLMSEMEKVMAYAGENKDITLDTVNAIGTRALQGQVFSMVEAIALGRSDQALALYYDLLALREPSMRILFLIARQFNQLMQVKLLTGQGMRQKELAEKMKLRPFVAGKLMDQARAFSEKQLTSYVELCTSSEEAVKTGRLGDQMAVELVIMTIAGRRKVSLERRLDG